MKRAAGALVLTSLLLAGAAMAGETLLGKLVVLDGGTTSNRCTAVPFVVTPLTKISIQCDSASHVLTDVAGCDAGNCIAVDANQFLTSSVNTSKTLTCNGPNPDGGVTAVPVTYTGGWVAMSPQGASSTCRVFARKGDE